MHTIILVRHGQTNYNLEGKIQDYKNPHLTDEGIKEAEAVKHKLQELGYKFDLIICADARRNRETLKILYPNFKNISKIKVDKRLRERFHKDIIGKNKEYIENDLGIKFTERLSWQLYFEGTNKSYLTGRYPGNETLVNTKGRILSLMDDVKDLENVLFIGSSIVNQYIIEYLRFKTIGIQRPLDLNNQVIDFQKNNELRIIELNDLMEITKFNSILC